MAWDRSLFLDEMERQAEEDDRLRQYPQSATWQEIGNLWCESPIERQLGHWLRFFCEKWGFRLHDGFVLGRFRFDFAIEKAGKVVALIECDGREFHSTPAQIENDAHKTKAAHDAGYLLFRRTGSKIWRAPRTCAEQIVFEAWSPGDGL